MCIQHVQMSSSPISDQRGRKNGIYTVYQGALLTITMICGKEMAAMARVNFMECQYEVGGWSGEEGGGQIMYELGPGKLLEL